jgi:hypothetical protein
MFKLTSSVPVPCKGRPFKYPFNTMKVGQSFLAPPHLRHNMRVLVSYHKRRGRGEFTCRVTPEGIRVWRTA